MFSKKHLRPSQNSSILSDFYMILGLNPSLIAWSLHALPVHVWVLTLASSHSEWMDQFPSTEFKKFSGVLIFFRPHLKILKYFYSIVIPVTVLLIIQNNPSDFTRLSSKANLFSAFKMKG
ncbi:hypothetical protein ILYODFUR_023910 [Ilyodon furcidens]|uniref:Uncharacterized protein n=1 Tax=Ilyodon furcidens TaxID=33524 RepID=A0ABV0TAK7_9TELE